MMTIIDVPKVNRDTGICFIELVNIDYVSFVDVTVICSTYKVACICTYKLNMHLDMKQTCKYVSGILNHNTVILVHVKYINNMYM